MKILIIQTAFIGDVVLATPLVEKLKQFHPQSEIDFVVRKGNESLLFNHPHLRQLFVFDKKKDKYKNVFRLIKLVRKEKYDYVINVQRFFTSGMLTALSGAKHTIGFDKNPWSFMFTTRIKHHISASQLNHEVARNLSLITSITDTEFVKPKLYPSAQDFKKIEPYGPYVCMAPASVWFTKQMPSNKWAELINALEHDFFIYLLGAKSDSELCNNILKQSGSNKVINLAGELSFLESAAFMKGAQMNYVNDSAPLHFASSMNAPVTAIFCSTVPAFGFGPLSDQSFVIEVEETLPCRPCGLHGKKACPQGHFKCGNISVNRMAATLKLNSPT